jgi:3-hydroxyisobutyrate dehydrogenase-like beta-hydroxyacid dehydrogenase
MEHEHAQPLSSVGFIGLGAMGLPMAKRICQRLTGGVQLFAFDIVSANVDQLVDSHKDTVVRCNSVREVAEKSVFFPQLGVWTPFVVVL